MEEYHNQLCVECAESNGVSLMCQWETLKTIPLFEKISNKSFGPITLDRVNHHFFKDILNHIRRMKSEENYDKNSIVEVINRYPIEIFFNSIDQLEYYKLFYDYFTITRENYKIVSQQLELHKSIDPIKMFHFLSDNIYIIGSSLHGLSTYIFMQFVIYEKQNIQNHTVRDDDTDENVIFYRNHEQVLNRFIKEFFDENEPLSTIEQRIISQFHQYKKQYDDFYKFVFLCDL